MQVSNTVHCNDSTAVNAADDSSGFLDEAAERAEFQKAVAIWRNSGTAVEVEVGTVHNSSDASMKKTIDKKTDSGMWRNPFMSMTDELEDITDTKSMKAKNRCKSDIESMTNYCIESERTYRASEEGNNSFLQGSLDEVAEHKVRILLE